MSPAPVFWFDLSSPYAYLAASRIDGLLPAAVWRPVSFGHLLKRNGRVPWSLGPDPSTGFAEIARRARERGLPEVRYPPGWPRDSYSLLPLRAAVHAGREGRVREFTLAAYAIAFAEGRALNAVDPLLEAAGRAGLDPAAMRAALDDPEVRDVLRRSTDEAAALGVEGVPAVTVGGERFWGDDRLEDAARRAGSA